MDEKCRACSDLWSSVAPWLIPLDISDIHYSFRNGRCLKCLLITDSLRVVQSLTLNLSLFFTSAEPQKWGEENTQLFLGILPLVKPISLEMMVSKLMLFSNTLVWAASYRPVPATLTSTAFSQLVQHVYNEHFIMYPKWIMCTQLICK